MLQRRPSRLLVGYTATYASAVILKNQPCPSACRAVGYISHGLLSYLEGLMSLFSPKLVYTAVAYLTEGVDLSSL